MAEYLLDRRYIGLYFMEGPGIFKNNPVNIAHIPTFLLAIGYPLFWVQMASGSARHGITSPAAWVLFVFFAVFVLVRERLVIADALRQCARDIQKQDRAFRVFLIMAVLGGLFVLACAFFSALMPPHLSQEGDTMNYHYSMPRQHLITGSFAHVPWSADDFFFLPLDFALAPFWFSSELPNKIPQFIFLLGLVGVIASLTMNIKKEKAWAASVLAVTAFLGSHGHGIQMGIAMLDLTICYLFLASMDSFLRRQKWLFIIEFTFFVWAKSLVPLQVAAIILLMLTIRLVLKKAGFKTVLLDFERRVHDDEKKANNNFLKEVVWGVLFLSIFVAGPFLAKSLYYTGTPVFPVAVGVFNFHPGIPEGSVAWTSMKAAADTLTSSIHRDGYGRSLIDFLTHFWMIAVPEEGVNNAFDYPLGLSYLLFLGPFLVFTVQSLRKKEFPIISLLIVVYWLLWWVSVRETRHLYAPVILMFILGAIRMRQPSKILLITLFMALLFNATSIYRAHRTHYGVSSEKLLRPDDKKIVDMSRQYLKDKRSDAVELEQFEVAYAQFPVMVRKEILPHVIAF